ncbi:hypothetical protein B0A48_04340 [Cryoendolithus antarcticus]|uniref:Uncharacterized protein n=1 Tax=Cryoendolithus antarcticus TaxID=1507870 RepID=A0A1V8TF36_9PEZI|nr:hypothetical protein B0A48_04340 [Cryoendolithus antarcticus]
MSMGSTEGFEREVQRHRQQSAPGVGVPFTKRARVIPIDLFQQSPPIERSDMVSRVSALPATITTTSIRDWDETSRVRNTSVSDASGASNKLIPGVVDVKMAHESVAHTGPPAPTKLLSPIPATLSTLIATSTRPANTDSPREVECYTYYHGVYSSFAIVGVSWDETLFRDGEGLKQAVKTCGTLTKWNFDTTWREEHRAFTWRAKGQLPIGCARCINRMIPGAGGPVDFVHCTGVQLSDHGDPT